MRLLLGCRGDAHLCTAIIASNHPKPPYGALLWYQNPLLGTRFLSCSATKSFLWVFSPVIHLILTVKNKRKKSISNETWIYKDWMVWLEYFMNNAERLSMWNGGWCGGRGCLNIFFPFLMAFVKLVDCEFGTHINIVSHCRPQFGTNHEYIQTQ